MEKPYNLRFWYPIFPSGWRLFCGRWWKHWVTPSHYWRFFSIKWERVIKGYSHEDVWNLNDQLIYLMVEMQKEFNATHHGYTFDTTPEQYDADLKTMLDGFIAMQEILSDQYYDLHPQFDKESFDTWYSERKAKWEKSIDIFKKEFSGLWD